MSFAICLTAQFFAWSPLVLYFVSLLPQIYTNWRQGSADGVSHRMVFLLITGSLSSLLYEQLLGLPLAYRIVRPFLVVMSCTVAFQGYYYTTKSDLRRNMILSYTILLGVFLCAAIAGFFQPQVVGGAIGWFAALIYAIYPLPQVYKNYQRASTTGLNFGFLTLVFVGNLIEMTAAMLFRLPMQSMVHGIRGMLYYSVFCYQFVIYSDREESHTKNRA